MHTVNTAYDDVHANSGLTGDSTYTIQMCTVPLWAVAVGGLM